MHAYIHTYIHTYIQVLLNQKVFRGRERADMIGRLGSRPPLEAVGNTDMEELWGFSRDEACSLIRNLRGHNPIRQPLTRIFPFSHFFTPYDQS